MAKDARRSERQSINEFEEKITDCAIVGKPSIMSEAQLPLCGDILRHFIWHVELDKHRKVHFDKRANRLQLLELITKIWVSSSIPILSARNISKKIDDLLNEYDLIKRNYNARHDRPIMIQKIQKLQIKCAMLFDIAACKCKLTKNYSHCKCLTFNRVPEKEMEFLKDQRTSRVMFIGGLDLKTTLNNMRRQARRMERATRPANTSHNSPQEVSKKQDSSSPSSSSGTFSDVETELPKTSMKRHGLSKSVRVKMYNTAISNARYGTSLRSGAMNFNAASEDLGVSPDARPVASKTTLSRTKKRVFTELNEAEEWDDLRVLCFDGRQTKTLVPKPGYKQAHIKKTMDHYVLMSEPDQRYIGHISPDSSTAVNIKTKILDYLAQKNISTDNLVAVSCDGTNTNTGKYTEAF